MLNNKIATQERERDFAIERIPDNYNPKSLTGLLLDVSFSMGKNDEKNITGISQINQSLKTLKSFFDDDPYICSLFDFAILAYSTDVKIVKYPMPLSEYGEMPELKARGRSNLLRGLEMIRDLSINYQMQLKEKGMLSGKPPFFWVITDGVPFPKKDNNEEDIRRIINYGINSNKYIIEFLGAGKDLLMKFLNRVSHSDFPPKPIEDSKIKETFENYLIPSISTYIR